MVVACVTIWFDHFSLIKRNLEIQCILGAHCLLPIKRFQPKNQMAKTQQLLMEIWGTRLLSRPHGRACKREERILVISIKKAKNIKEGGRLKNNIDTDMKRFLRRHFIMSYSQVRRSSRQKILFMKLFAINRENPSKLKEDWHLPNNQQESRSLTKNTHHTLADSITLTKAQTS